MHRSGGQPENEDARLVNRVLDGTPGEKAVAFRRLVEKYQRPLYALLSGILSSHEDIDDALQETFLRTFRSLHRYDPGRPMYPWLRRTAVNVALGMRRSNHRHRAIPLEQARGLEGKEPSLNPLFRLEQDEFAQRLRYALDLLPLEQRAVFQLRVQDELSYKEIAETLGIRIGTVMSRLNRARERLRQLLRHDLEAEVSS